LPKQSIRAFLKRREAEMNYKKFAVSRTNNINESVWDRIRAFGRGAMRGFTGRSGPVSAAERGQISTIGNRFAERRASNYGNNDGMSQMYGSEIKAQQRAAATARVKPEVEAERRTAASLVKNNPTASKAGEFVGKYGSDVAGLAGVSKLAVKGAVKVGQAVAQRQATKAATKNMDNLKQAAKPYVSNVKVNAPTTVPVPKTSASPIPNRPAPGTSVASSTTVRPSAPKAVSTNVVSPQKAAATAVATGAVAAAVTAKRPNTDAQAKAKPAPSPNLGLKAPDAPAPLSKELTPEPAAPKTMPVAPSRPAPRRAAPIPAPEPKSRAMFQAYNDAADSGDDNPAAFFRADRQLSRERNAMNESFEQFAKRFIIEQKKTKVVAADVQDLSGPNKPIGKSEKEQHHGMTAEAALVGSKKKGKSTLGKLEKRMPAGNQGRTQNNYLGEAKKRVMKKINGRTDTGQQPESIDLEPTKDEFKGNY
jgi:hypothetical protein